MRKGKEKTPQDKSTSKDAVFPEIPGQRKTRKNSPKKEEELDLPELEIPTYSQDPYQQTTGNLPRFPLTDPKTVPPHEDAHRRGGRTPDRRTFWLENRGQNSHHHRHLDQSRWQPALGI